MVSVQVIESPASQVCFDSSDHSTVPQKSSDVLNDIMPFLKQFAKAQDDYEHDAVIEMSKTFQNFVINDDSNKTWADSSHHQTDFEVIKADAWATEQIVHIPKWLDDEDLIDYELNVTSDFVAEVYNTPVHANSDLAPYQVLVDVETAPADDLDTGTNDPAVNTTTFFNSGQPLAQHDIEADGDVKETHDNPSNAYGPLRRTLPNTSWYAKMGWASTKAKPEPEPRQLEDQLLSTYKNHDRSISLSVIRSLMRLLLAWQLVLTSSFLCSKHFKYMRLLQSNMVVMDVTPKEIAIVLLIATTSFHSTAPMVPHAWRRWFLILLALYMLCIGVFVFCRLSGLHSQAPLVMTVSDVLLLNILNLRECPVLREASWQRI